jgi:hypothetical protein
MSFPYITVVSGNSGYQLNFTLTDANNVALDLTNIQKLTFIAQSVSNDVVQFSRNMTVVNPTAGTCQYTAQSTDFVPAGNYNAQIVVTYQTNEVITFNGIQITANPQLPLT